MKNTPGLCFRRHSGSVPAARANSFGYSVRMGPPLPIVDIAAEFTVLLLYVPINQPTSQTLGPRLGERASRASEVVIAGSAWHQEGHGLPTALQKRQLWQRRFFKTRACSKCGVLLHPAPLRADEKYPGSPS
jgi:hypothetical protein